MDYQASCSLDGFTSSTKAWIIHGWTCSSWTLKGVHWFTFCILTSSKKLKITSELFLRYLRKDGWEIDKDNYYGPYRLNTECLTDINLIVNNRYPSQTWSHKRSISIFIKNKRKYNESIQRKTFLLCKVCIQSGFTSRASNALLIKVTLLYWVNS